MNGEITFLETPIVVNIDEWMYKNPGLVSAGKKTGDSQKVMIIAFQRGDCASEQMAEYAKKHDAMVMVSISDGDMNVLD